MQYFLTQEEFDALKVGAEHAKRDAEVLALRRFDEIKIAFGEKVWDWAKSIRDAVPHYMAESLLRDFKELCKQHRIKIPE